MTLNENTIDFGEWRVPANWNELTFKQFIEIKKRLGNERFTIAEVVDILTGKDKEEIDLLPLDFFSKIIGQLTWLTEEPDFEPSNTIKIDGEEYSIHPENQLKVGEFIAADAIIKADRNDLATLLAILARKEGEVYDDKFENEVLDSRKQMFENAPALDCMALVAFFLTSLTVLRMPSLLSSEVEEELNAIAKHIETLEADGASKLQCMKLRKTLKRLKKLNKNI